MAFLGFLGELLITAGVLVLLFVAWQLWFNELVMAARHADRATELGEQWHREAVREQQDPGGPAEPVEPVIRAEPANPGETFANLIVPRFGSDYYRPIAQGVSRPAVLDTIGIGHYPGTQMPGEEGNFAVAAHRTTYGRPFHLLDQLVDGDRIWVETADGWYAYLFLRSVIVDPDAVEVLDPVPAGLTVADRYITLTTCHPLYSAAQRLVAYGVFERFHPRSQGIPDEIDYLRTEGE